MKPKNYWHHDPCVWCGFKRKRMSREHIEPLALGGAFGSENQAMACRNCNRHRGHTPMLLWLLALKATNHSAFHARRWAQGADRGRQEVQEQDPETRGDGQPTGCAALPQGTD